MEQLRTSFARWLAGSAVGSALFLSGCADAGIDLNGKVFDMMGISPSAQDARRFEPQIAERAPLVMPPDSNRLPAPGSGESPTAQLSWPDDPEARKQREAQERERLHLAYCKGDLQWKETVFKTTTGAPRSPYGPCPTLFSADSITNTLSKPSASKE
jgi:hypothetical protein